MARNSLLLLLIVVLSGFIACDENSSSRETIKSDSTKTLNASSAKDSVAIAISDSTRCNCDSLYQTEDRELLVSICRYIRFNNIPPPLDPCKLSIRKKHLSSTNGRMIYVVMLSCCYTGDSFTIDQKTKQVISYSPGDL